MAGTKIINKFGKMAGWNSVTWNMLGRDVEGITELEYNDEQEIENVYGAGGYPIGEADGNYSPTASVTLYLEEQQAILESLKAGERIQDIAPFDINVVYEIGEKVYKDELKNVRFKNNGRAVKQNDKTIAFKFDLKLSHINWNK